MDLTDLAGPAWVQLGDATFEMGSRIGRDDARPVHEVTLSAFRISRFPVTNEQYAAFVADTDNGAPTCARLCEWVDEPSRHSSASARHVATAGAGQG